ncbi:MAG: tetraacyldisaccharide 4'-kinase, partial [Cyclobacteriaceae bacterium]|nr:tetraacyldisaccharide 4'-kinase [Cyclobacteriaceae bacterium]
MRYLRLTLLPFSWLYGMIMDIRNRLYDAGIFKPVSFNLPVIAVGNLAAGGTGKTPMIEYIIRLLKMDHKIATLSRGYRRQTSGFKIASPADNASTIGDEPFQFYIKFNPEITVAVGEDRAYAIPHILNDHPDTDVLLMDDAFQHRRIKPNLEIL